MEECLLPPLRSTRPLTHGHQFWPSGSVTTLVSEAQWRSVDRRASREARSQRPARHGMVAGLYQHATRLALFLEAVSPMRARPL